MLNLVRKPYIKIYTVNGNWQLGDSIQSKVMKIMPNRVSPGVATPGVATLGDDLFYGFRD